MTPHSIYALLTAILDFALAIPPNTCIVIISLESLRKKEKLSPSDVIFMAKAMVNIIYQSCISLKGTLFVLFPAAFYIRAVHVIFDASILILMYFSFWMTAWLLAHYCTNITNLRYGFFIWLKSIVSISLSKVLSLTAVGLLVVCFPYICLLNVNTTGSSKNNSVSAPYTCSLYDDHYSAPVTFLGVILPFCLSLLCLLLTLSFLVRHVWRMKNNDSGSSRPNLQAFIIALRTIFFLLLMFTSFFMSQVVSFVGKHKDYEDPVVMVSWALMSFSPSAEAAIMFQASHKLRRFCTRRVRDAET